MSGFLGLVLEAGQQESIKGQAREPLPGFPWHGDATASALMSELVQAVVDPWEQEKANSFQHSFFLLNVAPSSAFPRSAIVISQLAGSTNILISCLLVRAAFVKHLNDISTVKECDRLRSSSLL